MFEVYAEKELTGEFRIYCVLLKSYHAWRDATAADHVVAQHMGRAA